MFTKKSRWSVMLHRLCFFISKALLMDRLTSSSCKLQLPFEVQQKRADTIRNQVASLPPKLLCCRLSEQLSAARVHFRLVHKAKRSEAHPANRERRLCAETFVLSFLTHYCDIIYSIFSYFSFFHYNAIKINTYWHFWVHAINGRYFQIKKKKRKNGYTNVYPFKSH